MNILFKPRENFTIVPNELLNSNKLSLQAKALYCYLISKPKHWKFADRRIATQMKEHRNTIQKYLKELEDNKLLYRRKLKKDDKFVGVAYYVANLNDSTVAQFTVAEDLCHISNTDNRDIKEKLSAEITVNQRKYKFRMDVIAVYRAKEDRMSPELAEDFFEYWTETNPNGRKMRFEMEPVFDISRRMETFIRNAKNRQFKNNRQQKSTNYKNT